MPGDLVGANAGDGLTFTIKADVGYVLVDLKMGGVSVLSDYALTNWGINGACTLGKVTADHTVGAEFYELTVLAGDANGDCVVDMSDFMVPCGSWLQRCP